MDQQQLAQAMDLFAERDAWMVSIGELREYFDDHSAGLKVMMHRHVSAGIVHRVMPGIYMHAKAHRRGKLRLDALVRCMRPSDYLYVSLDTALGVHDGQLKPTKLRMMTDGRSYDYKCDRDLFDVLFGLKLEAIEFRHTKRSQQQIDAGLSGQFFKGLPLATRAAAVADMTRTGCKLPRPEPVRGVQFSDLRPAAVAA